MNNLSLKRPVGRRRMSAAHMAQLAQARQLLENPGVAARIADVVGAPIESLLFKRSPRWVTRIIGAATQRALASAMDMAVLSVPRTGPPMPARNLAHKAAVAATGAVGGFFGLAGLSVELPTTTTLIMRSIAEIAREQGEDLDDPAARMACMEVFALGSKRSHSDDGSETGYFAVRAAIAQQVASAAEFVAVHGAASKAAPALVMAINSIASRFSIAVSEKAIAQSAPIIGAASGALINTLFITHFQAAARGHFMVRRLQREYGPGLVEREYGRLGAVGPGRVVAG